MNRESHPWAECVDGPWDLRKAVRRVSGKPGCYKIWATGGGIWRWETAMDQHYTMEEVQAVVMSVICVTFLSGPIVLEARTILLRQEFI